MQIFRHRGLSFVALGLFAGTTATTVTGCDEDSLCGPCGTIASGQLSISGDTKLDGFFKAVADLGNASTNVRSNFEAELSALGAIYGLGDVAVDANFVSQLVGAIEADFDANTEGGFRIEFVPPQCAASVSVAVEAQASCEVSADCEVAVDPGEVSVQCMGKCEATCEGGCSADSTIICEPPSGTVGCDVGCSGTCELEGSVACEGTCRGECSGNCSLTNAEGQCEGECDGMCTGSCEASAGASCEGTCHGTCEATIMPPGCEVDVEIECGGTCMGECKGNCAGEFDPPSASADCEASADCNAQASAQAEANVECTPPTVDFGFEFSGDANAEAAFLGRLELLKTRLGAALNAAARAQALFTGEVNGEVLFEVSPVANLLAEVNGLASADAIADFEIPAGKLTCVVPAFIEAAEVIGDVSTDLQFTAEASVELFSFVGA